MRPDRWQAELLSHGGRTPCMDTPIADFTPIDRSPVRSPIQEVELGSFRLRDQA